MKNRTNFYVSRRNVLTWLMALCMVSSAVVRIVFAGVKGIGGTQNLWSQILLPVAASLLFVLIALISGKEHFYRTAIPVWMYMAYHCFVFHTFGFDFLKFFLFLVTMLFVAVIYTQISSGKGKVASLLIPLMAIPLAVQLYLNRSAVLSGDYAACLPLLPDVLMTLGFILMVFALKVHSGNGYHPTWGDRCDGRRIRSIPPMDQLSPYIMVNRNGASNLFSESFEITNVERYIRQKRKEGMVNFGIMHVLLTSYCRALCRYPALNRFISGQKVFSRGNDVQFCLTVKKEMTSTSPETVIKVHLSPTDTAQDVYRKLNDAIEEVKNTPLDSGMDNTAMMLSLIPGVFLKFVVWLLKLLDYFGLIPKFLLEISPFHGSVYFTSMGSLGIPPVFHHLYNFGNMPLFCSFGCKRRENVLQGDGTVLQKKYIDFRITTDERIVDGFYYAAFFKHYKRIILHPEQLDNPPETVESDID